MSNNIKFFKRKLSSIQVKTLRKNLFYLKINFFYKFIKKSFYNKYFSSKDFFIRLKKYKKLVYKKLIKSKKYSYKQFKKIYDIKSLYHSPAYWENPLEFIPERFIDFNKMDKRFSPFGGGKRVCVGKNLAVTELNVAIIRLLQNFKFSVINKVWPIPTKSAIASKPIGVREKIEKK